MKAQSAAMGGTRILLPKETAVAVTQIKIKIPRSLKSSLPPFIQRGPSISDNDERSESFAHFVKKGADCLKIKRGDFYLNQRYPSSNDVTTSNNNVFINSSRQRGNLLAPYEGAKRRNGGYRKFLSQKPRQR
ncbi:hypothetical protein [Candidatus Berkiella aquae]|uniref:Uncharacterized protein n=1 Tax=Candidatus Berkiella aquae TaxID=295108 RepID=A0A0Q9Z1S0_9GAMM|nr:hypothetical protein [Candidatus Berkiella aquae]MCS5712380.1 hypothetical protein [Candidatus Berkiella aquae]